MIQAGDSIVLGVSGGADSVCLLFVLSKYRKKVPFSISVVHVNHGIREDAGEDEAYVCKLCQDLDIPYYAYHENVVQYAADHKLSEEDAGRIVRYRAFHEVLDKTAGSRIAVAHNANDRAETVLLHLFRGSGLRGLRGIEPVRDEIIRPILCLKREEIEDYLTEKGISWQTDSTNSRDEYTRNRLRHNVLPYVEEQIAENVVDHLCYTAQMLSETEKYMQQQTVEAIEECTENGEILLDKWKQKPEIIQKRMALQLLEKASPTGKDIFRIHIDAVTAMFTEEGNRQLNLPFGIVVQKQYDRGIIRTECSACERDESKIAETGKISLVTTVFPYEEGMEFPTNQYTKWFDYDKIKEIPSVRYRKVGDYFTLRDGAGNMIHKSVKEYMITEKIPAQDRDHIPLLALGDHVIWLIGYRISEYFKVDKNTKQVLQITIGEEQ